MCGEFRVTTSHDRFAVGGPIRNVLDLGIFGPAGHDLGNAAGFRGWSGGARDGFVIAGGHATPGYLAGPIEPGLWAVALGPVVLSPWGMAWQARITLERGHPDTESAPAIAHPPPPVRRAGWYRGDLHLHTVHSDGQRNPGELVAAAHVGGLDFIVSTDHNTNSANRVWPACRTGGLLVIPGEEVTTRHGHWLAVGLPPHAWVDWRYAPRDGVFPRFAAEVREGGGLVVAAHPAAPVPGSLWEFGFDHVDALEVWNGRWNLDDEVSLRIWQRLLCDGRRVVAVGGSDSHAHQQPVGSPQTVVHARELSTPAIVDGLRRGRSVPRPITGRHSGTHRVLPGPGRRSRADTAGAARHARHCHRHDHRCTRHRRRPDHRGGPRRARRPCAGRRGPWRDGNSTPHRRASCGWRSGKRNGARSARWSR